MKKRPEWFKKFNDTVETTTKTFGQVLQKTGPYKSQYRQILRFLFPRSGKSNILLSI